MKISCTKRILRDNSLCRLQVPINNVVRHLSLCRIYTVFRSTITLQVLITFRINLYDLPSMSTLLRTRVFFRCNINNE